MKNKRAGRRILLVLLALLVGFLFLRKGKSRSTFTLMETEMVEETVTGRGAFVFYEWAPESLDHLDMVNVNDKIRYRIDTPIQKLDAPWQQQVKKGIETARYPEEKAYLKKVLEQGSVLMPFSGLVSSQRDGYESLYTPESLSDWQPGCLGQEESTTNLHSGIKFMENRLFYLAVDLPSTIQPQSLTVGEDYVLKTGENVSLEGQLDMVRSDEEGRRLLIFSLRDGLLRVWDHRLTSIRVVVRKTESFRVPISATFQEADGIYCYVLNEKNVAEKIPLRITGVDANTDEFFVSGEQEEQGDETLPSLSRYDRVIRDPSDIEEGGLYQWE